LSLSAKIGDDRMYVVKSFPNLFEQIEDKEKVSYGKFLTMVHDVSVFDEPTQSILLDLKSLQNPDQTSVKEIEIVDKKMGKLYDMLEKLPEHYHNVDLVERTLDINIEVEMFDEETYILRMVEENEYT